jgi:peroxiredoxin
MSEIPAGQPAPSFRLPSAQGPDVALDDYRGKQNLVVWFTKGMGCPFCRAQMSQLARAYGQIRELGAEVLEVTVTPLSRARLYAQKFPLPFPYLCDPDLDVRKAWGMGVRSHGPLYYVKQFVAGSTATKPPNDYGDFMPAMDEMGKVMRDDDMGFFLVDKQGVIRYATSGPYVSAKGSRPIPGNEEVLQELAKLG